MFLTRNWFFVRYINIELNIMSRANSERDVDIFCNSYLFRILEDVVDLHLYVCFMHLYHQSRSEFSLILVNLHPLQRRAMQQNISCSKTECNRWYQERRRMQIRLVVLG